MFARNNNLNTESLIFFVAGIISASRDNFGIEIVIPIGLYFTLAQNQGFFGLHSTNSQFFFLGWLLGTIKRLEDLVQQQADLSDSPYKPAVYRN
jgi:hypothetical protein